MPFTRRIRLPLEPPVETDEASLSLSLSVRLGKLGESRNWSWAAAAAAAAARLEEAEADIALGLFPAAGDPAAFPKRWIQNSNNSSKHQNKLPNRLTALIFLGKVLLALSSVLSLGLSSLSLLSLPLLSLPLLSLPLRFPMLIFLAADESGTGDGREAAEEVRLRLSMLLILRAPRSSAESRWEPSDWDGEAAAEAEAETVADLLKERPPPPSPPVSSCFGGPFFCLFYKANEKRSLVPHKASLDRRTDRLLLQLLQMKITSPVSSTTVLIRPQ